MDNVVELDNHREIEDIIKRRFGAKRVIFSAELESGEIATYIPNELMDFTLVYMIQTFKDRRQARVDDVNS